MRIVYIDDFFHPDAGYQDNVLTKYWSKFGHDVFIITSEVKKIPSELTEFFECDDINEKDRRFERENRVAIIRIPLIAYVSGRSIYSKEIFSAIKKAKPDLVFVNGNDSMIGMVLTWMIKKNNYLLVLDSHMLEMASQNRFRKLFRVLYRKLFTPIIIKEHIPVIRTQDDLYVEKCLGIPIDRCPYISFGSDTEIFHPDNRVRVAFRKKYKVSETAFVVLYAGKLSKSKGADILINVLQKDISHKREVVFLIIGNTEGEFGLVVENGIKNAKSRVIRFPTQKYLDLAGFYQAADAAVFPRQCSLSFFDVQACGLPVIFEDNNINTERGRHGNAITFRRGDDHDLAKKIKYLAELKNEEFCEYKRNSMKYIVDNYKYEDKANEYIDLFKEILYEKNKDERK